MGGGVMGGGGGTWMADLNLLPVVMSRGNALMRTALPWPWEEAEGGSVWSQQEWTKPKAKRAKSDSQRRSKKKDKR